MKRSVKRILPILLTLVVLGSLVWYLFVYDRDFTRDMLLNNARLLEEQGKHSSAAWFYDLAYRYSGNNEDVAIELAERFQSLGNYTKAEYTLSNAIADGGSAKLYVALSKLYVEQDKLLDAVTMLDNVSDPVLKAELDQLRPEMPVANPAPGFYSQYIQVELTAGAGELYISQSREYPSTETGVYSAPLTLGLGENRINALTVGQNGLVSKLGVYGYTIGGVVEEVTFADPQMDIYLHTLLGIDPAERILTSDLWNIKELTVPKDVTDYSDLQYMTGLEILTVEDGSSSGLQVLSALSQLTEVRITGMVISGQDMKTIAALPNLKKLTLSGCQISSIKNLAEAKGLNFLDLSDNMIRDVTQISFMTGLEELNLSRNAVTNLNSISPLKALKKLDVSYNSLASLIPLADCTELEELNVSNNGIGTLSGLGQLTKLKKLDASFNTLTEAEVLAGNTALTELNLSNNTLLDIAPLAALNNLQYFDFSYNEITALPAFDKSCQLVTIIGSYNQVTSVEALGGLKKLNRVTMDYNTISSVNALADCRNLIQVSVYGNPVKDVSALTDMSVVVHYTPAV